MSAPTQRRFVVEYSLPYLHCVQVGIEAGTRDEAIATAERLCDSGGLWDDTPSLPLLHDDYEEDDDGSPLTFKIATEVEGDWPLADPCVQDLRRRELAFAAARALVAAYRNGAARGGSVDWADLDAAHALALRATEA